MQYVDSRERSNGAMRYVIGRFRETMERLDSQHPEMKPFDGPDYAIARSIKTLCHDGPDQTLADRDQTLQDVMAAAAVFSMMQRGVSP
jgi:hypothetical protein